jgi:ribonuclease P protein component
MPAKIEFQQSASLNQSFGKSLRLLCASDFKPVFDNAPVRASHQNFLILARFNQQTQPRLGLVIAKKHLRFAVQRNRMKRLIRESFRKQQQSFQGLDVIVLSRKGVDQLLADNSFSEQLEQQWLRIFKKARHLRLTAQPQVKTTESKANDNAAPTD